MIIQTIQIILFAALPFIVCPWLDRALSKHSNWLYICALAVFLVTEAFVIDAVFP